MICVFSKEFGVDPYLLSTLPLEIKISKMIKKSAGYDLLIDNLSFLTIRSSSAWSKESTSRLTNRCIEHERFGESSLTP